MKVKSVFYAAVGAPVVVARKVGDKTSEVYGKATSSTRSRQRSISTRPRSR
jgi:hypothetical protein